MSKPKKMGDIDESPCFICEKPMQSEYPSTDRTPEPDDDETDRKMAETFFPGGAVHGLAFVHTGAFGSSILNPVAYWERIHFVICDRCIMERADRLWVHGTLYPKPTIGSKWAKENARHGWCGTMRGHGDNAGKPCCPNLDEMKA